MFPIVYQRRQLLQYQEEKSSTRITTAGYRDDQGKDAGRCQACAEAPLALRNEWLVSRLEVAMKGKHSVRSSPFL